MGIKSSIVVAMLLVVLSAGSVARADFTLNVDEVFYSAMGGGPFVKNYVLTCNTGAGEAWESMAFLKFDLTDLPSAPVPSAWLSLENIPPAGGMTLTQPSEDEPVKISVQTVTEDVSKITSGQIGVSDFQDNYIGDEIDTAEITVNGFYYWDVTELVNAWIGGADNYGFALTGRYDDDFDPWLWPHFAGKPNAAWPDSLGAEPVIANVPLPEPASAVLLLSGGVLAMFRRR